MYIEFGRDYSADYWIDYYTDTTVDSARFPDAAQIDSWAAPSVALLTNNGLMSGKDTGVAPHDNTTVEEAIILVLALNKEF